MKYFILFIGVLTILLIYCIINLWEISHNNDRPKKKVLIKDIPWNHNFKVNEYYNQFGDNLKSIINT
jgi:hypothetical protein